MRAKRREKTRGRVWCVIGTKEIICPVAITGDFIRGYLLEQKVFQNLQLESQKSNPLQHSECPEKKPVSGEFPNLTESHEHMM